ncbi:MAG: LysR family transcriptional regulator [Gemmatimonadales bacterium]|nr:MAG: LysR family transcriptional regulator [Gemmatimonadales bacterium]
MPTLRQLRYFLAVAEELHFSQAAARIGVSQPSLSAQIQRLESTLGCRLLHRDRRTVGLTDEGSVFVARARSILREVDHAVREVRDRRDGIEGELRIAFTGSAGFRILPDLVGSFRSERPRVNVSLQELPTARQLDALESGHVDACLLRDPPEDPNLDQLPLLSESLVVALPRSHRLASLKRVPLVELASEPFIFQPRIDGLRFHDTILSVCQEAGFFPQIVQEAENIQTHVSLVAAGIGISILPGIARGLRHPGIVYRPIGPRSVPITHLVLAWRRSDDRPLTRAFVAVARDRTGRRGALPN